MGRKSTLQPGQVINRTYEMVRLLGAGYSGEVWEARHVHLHAPCAVKIMHPEDLANAHKSSRFRAEAEVLYGVKHENIVRILDANETAEGLFFLVMELLAGETLTERLVQGRLHPLRALKYAYGIACGLDAAHEIGVVHRDVKPDNVFITLADVIKILDFTAAKFFLVPLRTTEPAARVGTLAFMSQEHIEGETTDARIDQYSLALVIYCMLRGQHPFERHFSSQYKLMQAQALEIPEPLAKVVGLPSCLDQMLAPALAKKIDQRYPTMAEFARAIHEALRRIAREMREGTLTFGIPLGEPPIDVEGEPAGRDAKKVYLAPEEPIRQTTAPIVPVERVSVAPEALPDAPAEDAASFESAATAKLPVSRHARTEPVRRAMTTTTTTAAVGPTTKTAPVARPSRSRAVLAPLALVLALPAAAGLGWRWKVRAAASAPSSIAVSPSAGVAVASVAAAPARVAELPPPHEAVVTAPAPVSPSSAPALPSAPAVIVTATARRPALMGGEPPKPAAQPVTPAPPAGAPRGEHGPILADSWSERPAPSTSPKSPAPAVASPPPAPPSPAPSTTTAPHRIFGTDN